MSDSPFTPLPKLDRPANGNSDDPSQIPGSGSGMDRKIEKKLLTPRRIVLAVAIVAFVVAVGYGFWTTTGGSRLNVDLEKITVATAEQAPFQEFITVIGAIEPIRTVYLDAVEGGRIEELFIEQGTLVDEGDPILRLTNNNIQLDLLNREAQLYETINYLRQARLDMEQNTLSLRQQMVEINYQIRQLQRRQTRNEQLFEKKLISELDYETTADELDYWNNRKELTQLSHTQDSLLREAQVDQLESSVDRMQRNLDVVRTNLENLVVKAPIAGQLTSLNADIGESIANGQRLGQVDRLDGFKVNVPIDEYYLSRISPEQRGNAVVAGDSVFLEIVKVYPEVLDGRFEVDMEFRGDEPAGIRRGQTMRINVNLGDLSDAVVIPRGGFYQTTGGNWIYVVDPSGDFATKRTIRIGRQNSQYYEVLEGLEPGERVVTSSYDTFGDGGVDRLVFN